MSRVLLLSLLVITILRSQIGFAFETKFENSIPSPTIQATEEKAKDERVRIGTYRDLKWYRQIKLSALDHLSRDYVKNVAVLYKYEPVKFINAVPWTVFMKEMKSGHLAFADVKEGEYQILHDSAKLVEMITKNSGIDYQMTQSRIQMMPLWENMKVLLSTVPAISDIKPIGRVVSWNTGAPVSEILSKDLVPDQPKPADPS